jgi:hypothetical protein
VLAHLSEKKEVKPNLPGRSQATPEAATATTKRHHPPRSNHLAATGGGCPTADGGGVASFLVFLLGPDQLSLPSHLFVSIWTTLIRFWCRRPCIWSSCFQLNATRTWLVPLLEGQRHSLGSTGQIDSCLAELQQRILL